LRATCARAWQNWQIADDELALAGTGSAWLVASLDLIGPRYLLTDRKPLQ